MIPAHNEAQYLSQTLDSLIAQTYRYWRAIVVDDQSSDATTVVASRYAERDLRIEVLRLRRNAGLPAARNAGLAQVRDPFVMFLDGDDTLLPDALEVRLRVLTADGAAAGAYGKTRQVPADASWQDEARSRNRGGSQRRITLISAAGENPFGIHEVLMRTSAARVLGGFDETLRGGGEDVDFWTRALRSGMEFPGTGKIDCLYRQRPASMVSVGPTRHMDTVVGLLDAAWQGDSVPAEVSGRPQLGGDLGDVLRRGMLESRLLKYLGMVAYGENPDAIDQVRAELLKRAPFCLSRESAQVPVLSGLKRSALRAGVENTDDLALRADQLLQTLSVLFQSAGPELTARRAHPSWAVLVEHRAHAVAVTGALSDLDPQSWPVFLLGDTVDADMGAAAFLSEQRPGVLTRSLSKFLLEQVCYDQLVVPGPVTWLGRLAADEAAARGASVRVLDLPWSASVTVDDEEAQAAGVNTLQTPSEPVSLKQLGGIAAERTRTDLPRSARPAPEVTWPGRVRPDGSAGDYRGMARPSVERLLELRDSWRGQRAVIIGNGPSLNHTDLDLLKGVPTFGVNGIYYAGERLPEPLTFYVVEDTKVFEENTDDVLAYGRSAETFLLPTLYAPSCGPADDPVFFRMNGGFYRAKDHSHCRPRFSTNASEVLYCGQSVTIINLQLAYWFGFSEIALIGMDFNYTVPAGTKIKGSLYTSAGDDPNHFDSRYFGAGKTWKDPRLNRVLANYGLARAIYESDRRRVVNCTVGGKLEAFDRVDLADFVRG